MKNFLILINLIFGMTVTLHAQGSWTTLKTGAGGWITGMDIHPDGTKYIRSDVGGAYRLDNGSDTWRQIVTSSSMPAEDVKWSAYAGVLSIASAPSDEERTYMAYHKTVYYSDNRGDLWERTNFPDMYMEANADESKLFGERLEVDPINKDKVYFGSIDDGLFVTNDGMNWQKVIDIPHGAEGRGVRSIAFDPASGSGNGNTQIVYVAVDGEGIFRSADMGVSFTEITQGLFTHANPWIYDMEIDGSGHLYISGKDEAGDGSFISLGLLKYDGNNWTQIFDDNLSIPYSEIAVDPVDNDRVLLFSEGYSETYISRDATGNDPSWEYIAMQRSADNVPWMAWTETEWFTLGEIEFDPLVEDRIWITFGTGTYYIDEDGSNPLIWNEFSIGQEHLVSNDAVTFSNGNVLTAHWDFPLFMHTPDNDYPSTHLPSSRFNSCWDLSQSSSDENFVVALIEDIRYCCWDGESRNSSYSEDGGQTWTRFPSMPGDEFDLIFGQMEVSTENNDNIIWLPVYQKSVYVTQDKASSWIEVPLPGASEACCLDGPWFRRKILAADKVRSGKFYIYDWGSGDVFVTIDGGLNWLRQQSVLPAWSFNGKLIAVPEHEDHLFFSNGPEESEDLIEGLLRSTDGGLTWDKVLGTSKVLNVTVGKTAPDGIYPTVYICGEVNGEFGYYESTDNCSSWSPIGKYPEGIYDWPVSMEADPHNYGKLIIGFKGNGFVQYENSQSISLTLTERIHIDQFGYKPTMSKVAVISDPQVGFNNTESYTPGSTLKVVNADNDNVVYTGAVQTWNQGTTHDQSGDKGWHFDFTALETVGNYYILDEANNTKSYTFEISENVYNEVLKSATKMFYYNRCNMAKEMPYAEANWTDGNNFNNDLQDGNARYIYDQGNSSLEKDLSGGWFDAGDYNKYVTFAHGAVHNLLSAYDENSNVFTDDWNIPESGNGISDLLDELNWELQWLEKMMNVDGSTHIKIGAKNYAENISSPPSSNTDQRYYGPVCSAASIAVSSMFAHAAWTYKTANNLQTYSSTLEAKAVTAFDYYLSKQNSNDLDTDCDDGSIVSGDADWEEIVQRRAALIAAVYLYDLTGDDVYGNYIIQNVTDAEAVANGWMGPYQNPTMEALFLYTTFPTADPVTSTAIIDAVYPHVSQDWDGFYGQNDLDLYRSYIPEWSYHWGSNQVKADYGNLNAMVARYDINPAANNEYLLKAEELVHYYHGVNPLTKVYLSNMGSRGAENSVDELYHTWFADGTDYDNVETSLYGPAPGFVPGGANQNYTFAGNNPPYGQPAQKSYLDFNTGFPDASWEITEPAIYYQASYIRLLASYATMQSVVPLDLISFEAERVVDDVLLSWTTANAINTDRFEIESGVDMSSFNKIGEVDAIMGSTALEDYEFTDSDVDDKYAAADIIYYRLKMYDLDGMFEYSPVRSIALTNITNVDQDEILIYPNPSSKQLFIESKSENTLSDVQITNMLGQQVFFKGCSASRLEIDVSEFPQGTYVVHLGSGSSHITYKFLKVE